MIYFDWDFLQKRKSGILFISTFVLCEIQLIGEGKEGTS